MLNIIQVNLKDSRGGAAAVAGNLHQAYQKRGLNCWMVVGKRLTEDPRVLALPYDNGKSLYLSAIDKALKKIRSYKWRNIGLGTLDKALQIIGQPQRIRDSAKGLEDFNYPGSWRLLELATPNPNIVHCHNLHTRYFDLRVLPWLSHQIPVLLTLHDAWLLSGHCAHSFECDLWKCGCGSCPDLSIYPAIKRDASGANWLRKREIFSKSKFYIATPSAWLMQRVKESMLVPGIIESRVIPNGVDISVFRPVPKQHAKAKLGIPENSKTILFSANGIRRNVWKDFKTIRSAITLVAEHFQDNEIIFLALGEDAPMEVIENARIRFIPFQENPQAVASYYQAADIYVHAARVDTFPTSILEALACGTPAVATSVGGIPEQIKSLATGANAECGPLFKSGDATGILVPPGDHCAMADGIIRLFDNKPLCRQLRGNAVEDARKRFSLARQVDEYIEWYQKIVNTKPSGNLSRNAEKINN